MGCKVTHFFVHHKTFGMYFFIIVKTASISLLPFHKGCNGRKCGLTTHSNGAKSRINDSHIRRIND